jgi:hypothetical protein
MISNNLIKDEIIEHIVNQKIFINYNSNYEKVLIINTIFGLGNRLRAIASAYSICKIKNMKLIINWIPDEHCDCLIQDLIVNIHEFAEVICQPIDNKSLSDFKIYNYFEKDEGGKKGEYIDDNINKIYIKSNCILNNKDSYTYFNEFLQSLKWNDDINNLIINIPEISNYIGMHIRMEGGKNFQNINADKAINWTNEETELMFKYREISHIDNFINQINNILHKNPEQNFFIATDMKSNYERLINIYGSDRIKIIERNFFDRSKEQLYYAVADMILLSRCKQFYGSSWSSFSELVTYYQTEEIKNNNVFSTEFKNDNNYISICYACKNRHDNLFKSIKSIIDNEIINDIVVVDWDTDEIDLYKLLKTIPTENFWKINYIKITNKVSWILTYAFNISFIHAKNKNIIKSDCDYIFSKEFIQLLSSYNIKECFYSFDYASAVTKNQKHLNGFFYFNKDILKKVVFNHNILFYGFDDCDLKMCLVNNGYKYNKLELTDKELYHIISDDIERVKNQDTICGLEYINFFGFNIKNCRVVGPLIQYNKILCDLYPNETTENDVVNLLKSEKVEYRYSEYSLLLEKIPTYNTSCNPLYNEKTICRYDVFAKMKNDGYWFSDDTTHFGNIIVKIQDKYDIVDIKNNMILFMFFFNVVKTKKTEGNNHLVISLYNESNISRALELLFCLRENLNNKYINKVHILMENSDKSSYFLLECINKLMFTFGEKDKIKIIPFDRRPTFNDYFEYCNKNIEGNAIVANSDIVYDDTLSKIENIIENEFIVLTRYNKYDDIFKIFHFTDKNMIPILNKVNIFSQDTWIFKSPMYDNIDIPMFVGSMFSDSFINYRLSTSKYNVYNKAKFIRSYHVQKEPSLSEIITKDEKDKIWNEIYTLIKHETKDFIYGVPLQELDGNHEIPIKWQTFWDSKTSYYME